MNFKMFPRAMILATAIALPACGDDGPPYGGDGSTGSSSSGPTTDDSAGPSTTSMVDTGSTSSAEGSSSTTTTEGTSSETGAGESTTSADSASGSDDGTSTGSVDAVTISGTVTDFGTPTALEGVEVCVFERAGVPCATTDAEGAYTLMGVPVAEGAIAFTRTGRFPSLFWGEGPMDGDVLDYNLLSNLAAAVLAASLEEEIDDGSGHLALAVSDGEGGLLSGASFTMTPSSGAIGYLTPDGIDPTLIETTQVGFAGWLNVEVGEVEITASHPTLDCVPGPGALVGSTPDALRIDITAGYLGSTFPFVCS